MAALNLAHLHLQMGMYTLENSKGERFMAWAIWCMEMEVTFHYLLFNLALNDDINHDGHMNTMILLIDY
jgi:hypothetical protein